MPFHKNCIDEMADGPAGGDSGEKCFGCAIEKNECECACSCARCLGGGGGGSCGYVPQSMCAPCVGRHILRDKEEMGRLASRRLAALGVSATGFIFDAANGALSLAMDKMATDTDNAPWAWEILCEVRNVLGFPGRRHHRPSCGLEDCPCVLQILGELLLPHIKPSAARALGCAHRRMGTLHQARHALLDTRAELERVTEQLREREHVFAEEERLNGEAMADARAFWEGRPPREMEVEEGDAERLEGEGDAERLEQGE